jgi:hypothetical protein
MPLNQSLHLPTCPSQSALRRRRSPDPLGRTKVLNVKTLIAILSLMLISQSLFGQEIAPQRQPSRYPFQSYIEDSTHVFWTSYPNPFSPPTVSDSGMARIHGLTFYCDISDTVTVSLLGGRGSVLYEASVESQGSPHFTMTYWPAGPRAPSHKLPAHFFRADSAATFGLLLSVGGHRKCSRQKGIDLLKGWYCWIDTKTPKKH